MKAKYTVICVLKSLPYAHINIELQIRNYFMFIFYHHKTTLIVQH